MKYETVIFDLDGTLLNTLEDLANSTNYALEMNGYPKRTLEEVRNFVGNGYKKLIQRALSHDVEESVYEKVLHDFKKYYEAHCNDHTAAYKGVPELLKELSQSGYQMAIVSNKGDAGVKTLNQLYFSEYIPVAIGETSGIRKKPAPDTVLEAMRILKANPDTTVYVGDSQVDIETARNAKIPCISVDWGFRDREFLQENGADIIVSTTEELLKEL